MTKTSKVSVSIPPKSFEEATVELENIVAEMEAGQMTLEASLDAYKRGVATLLQFCQKQLQDAQQQVRVLEADLLKDYTIPDTHDR